MKDQTRLIRDPEAITADVGEDVVFLHEGEGQYYSLTEVGALVWKTLASPSTFGEVVAAVLAEYDATEAQVREDLDHLFAELEAKGIVRTEAGSGQ